jgi:hypothetical protein
MTRAAARSQNEFHRALPMIRVPLCILDVSACAWLRPFADAG